jgi:cyclic pyranopterin phosphate synthase
VVQLTSYSEKGQSGKLLDEATLVKDHGMLGDCHALGGERQLTLISKSAKDWLNSSEIKGLCFEKFHENMEIEEMSLETLKDHAKLKIGEAVLELSPVRKKCYPELCKLTQEGTVCLLLQEVRFAKVINSGAVAVGMEVIMIGDSVH